MRVGDLRRRSHNERALSNAVRKGQYHPVVVPHATGQWWTLTCNGDSITAASPVQITAATDHFLLFATLPQARARAGRGIGLRG